jgi:C-terminal processing protease CtpA/Prc
VLLPLASAQDRTPPATGEGEEAHVLKLTEALKDEDFSKREDASRRLAAASPKVIPHLLRLARKSSDPEQTQRLLMAARKIFMTRVAKGLPDWHKARGFLGIGWQADEDAPGVGIDKVFEDSAAESAGLKEGDVILGINGKRFKQGQVQKQASAFWRQMLDGDEVNLLVQKADEDKPKLLTATVREVKGSCQTPSIAKEEVLWLRYQQRLLAGR